MRKEDNIMFDDFDTQVQADEISREELQYWDDLTHMCHNDWLIYPVDCDDGTSGDMICIPNFYKSMLDS